MLSKARTYSVDGAIERRSDCTTYKTLATELLKDDKNYYELVISKAKAACSEDVSINSDCTTCYKALAAELLENDKNFYKLQMTFFPPNSNSPVFVTVVYQYDNSTYNNWSSAIYFFFHPHTML